MHTSQDYPFDYGFIPRSLWHDHDPLDIVDVNGFEGREMAERSYEEGLRLYDEKFGQSGKRT